MRIVYLQYASDPVTFLQLTLEMAMSTTVPIGYGHVYAPAHYIDAWVEVTKVQGWTLQDISRLKQHFETSPTESVSTHVQN